jgi:hypothetical protein
VLIPTDLANTAYRVSNAGDRLYEAVKSALGGDPFFNGPDARGDPLALRLPDDLALFRRYVEPETSAAGTGFVMVPRVRKMAEEGEGERNEPYLRKHP